MRIDRAQMKADAKQAMRGRRPSVYLVALGYAVIMLVLAALSTRLQFPGMTVATLLEMEPDSERYLVAMMQEPSFGAQLLSIALDIMSFLVGVGFTSFCLNVSRNLAAGFGNLFDAFGFVFRIIALQIMIAVFVFLWSCLFIIPGIVAGYRYSMAIYIMLDDPDKGVMQCIRESKEMTRGYKAQLFWLDVSFIGWGLLSYIPFVSLYTMPYMSVTTANYYRVISGRSAETEQI